MTNSIKLIDNILDSYKNIIGKDFNSYRNHVHRVFSVCKELDSLDKNEEKYAIAAVFHDLGIWTNNTFDYLEPSIILASNYLKSLGKADLVNEISAMIDMHHKITKYTGDHETTVETFRRADWIDVTKGVRLFGLKRTEYLRIKGHYPILGFHKFLVSQTLKNFLKSPFNPLPMFKK